MTIEKIDKLFEKNIKQDVMLDRQNKNWSCEGIKFKSPDNKSWGISLDKSKKSLPTF